MSLHQITDDWKEKIDATVERLEQLADIGVISPRLSEYCKGLAFMESLRECAREFIAAGEIEAAGKCLVSIMRQSKESGPVYVMPYVDQGVSVMPEYILSLANYPKSVFNEATDEVVGLLRGRAA